MFYNFFLKISSLHNKDASPHNKKSANDINIENKAIIETKVNTEKPLVTKTLENEVKKNIEIASPHNKDARLDNKKPHVKKMEEKDKIDIQTEENVTKKPKKQLKIFPHNCKAP